MSLDNRNSDASCLKAVLDVVEKSTSISQAVIENASKLIESTEQSEFDNSKIENEKLRKVYKLNVWLHHENIVDVELPGTSMKEAASAASARRTTSMTSRYKATRDRPEETIQFLAASSTSSKSMLKTTATIVHKEIQCRSNRCRYHLRNTAAKNYKVRANRTLRVEKKEENMMMKELVPPIRDRDQAFDSLCPRVRKSEMDATETRDAKKRKDEDEIVIVNI